MGLEVPPEVEQFTKGLIKKRLDSAARQKTPSYKADRIIAKNKKHAKQASSPFKYKEKEKVIREDCNMLTSCRS